MQLSDTLCARASAEPLRAEALVVSGDGDPDAAAVCRAMDAALREDRHLDRRGYARLETWLAEPHLGAWTLDLEEH